MSQFNINLIIFIWLGFNSYLVFKILRRELVSKRIFEELIRNQGKLLNLIHSKTNPPLRRVRPDLTTNSEKS